MLQMTGSTAIFMRISPAGAVRWRKEDQWQITGLAARHIRRPCAPRPCRPRRGPASGSPRAARRRAGARRRFLAAVGAVAAVVAIVVALIAVKLTSGPTHGTASESLASAALVRQITTVPTATLAQVSPGQATTQLEKVERPGPVLTINGKPTIIFVSEESCPFCAAERWALTVALSRFGSRRTASLPVCHAAGSSPEALDRSGHRVRGQQGGQQGGQKPGQKRGQQHGQQRRSPGGYRLRTARLLARTRPKP